MIRIERVSKSYDNKVAVDDVSLDIPAGSVFGLIGPNGAGKTTTLKMLSTLIKPDSGSLSVDELDLTDDVRAARRIIGYMPDKFGAFRGLTGVEYLEFFGRAYGLTGTALAARIRDVLELTDLTGVRDEITTALSTGMAQRLSLAKTLLHDPAVLLLDEPASGLDPRARIEIRSLLRELGKMGKTIVISSHILADLDEICTDVAILERGQIVWNGSLSTAREPNQKGDVSVTIRVPESDLERTVRTLSEIDGVGNSSIVGDHIEATVGEGASNGALRRLLDEGIEILAFSQDRTNLEALFLNRTKGLVS